jgi:peptide/nickel transport system substrate-binding protein
MNDVHDNAAQQLQAAFSRRSFLGGIALGAGGLAAFGLSGCGMTSDNSGGGAGKGAASLKAAFERPIISLDPHGASDVDEGTLLACRHIFDTLVVRDGDTVKPGLATAWEQPDATTWVFHLRDGVTFHDGTPLTADDVKASLERLVASKTPQSALWASLASVRATDTKTVTIKTTTPLGTILANLTLLFVAPAGKLSQQGFFDKPVGSGPFRVDSFTASEHLNLSANGSYWGTKPTLSALQLPYIPETSTRLTSLRTGEVDVTWSIPPDQIKQVSGASGVQVASTDSYVYYFNWFNCGRPPFNDARVRQAMWYAIDVKKVVSSLFGDTAEVMNSPIPPTVFGYAAQQPYPYDPDKAKQLLAQAGHPNGFSTSLMWSQGIAPQIRSVAEAFNSYWSKIGVNVQLMELEQATWLKKLLALDWDMDLQNNSVTTGDADYTLGRLYTSKANRMGYSNAELDQVLTDARSSTDQQARKTLYAKACKIIWDDAVGIFPLQIKATYGLRKSVQGFVPAPNNQPMFTAISKR